jgi:ubiquinone/menaquinone biosynthesis C-methylase UbiE
MMSHLRRNRKEKKINTSWGRVAQWYDKTVDDQNSFQHKVIWPALKQRLELIVNKGTLLDIGCGTGFFSTRVKELGFTVKAFDIAGSSVEIAKEKSTDIDYFTMSAEDMNQVKNGSIDIAICVLTIQNVQHYETVFAECSRVMKPGSKVIFVLNHPAFRQPKNSSWFWDMETKTQSRKLEKYLSQYKIDIQMQPGDNPSNTTPSFHRPISNYVNTASKVGFSLTHMDELISHIPQDQGPKTLALEVARKEFPLFLLLEFKLEH